MVAWLFIIGNAVSPAIGAFVFLLLTGIGLSVEDVEARSILLVVGPAVGMLLVILAIPGLLTGYGLLNRQPNQAPGGAVALPFVWPEPPTRARGTLNEPPRIGKLLQHKPWLFLKFLAGDV